jgi:hypothetical protein
MRTGYQLRMFELVDKKSKKYIKKEFYENGRIKEEGSMVFRKDLGDYQKDGVGLIMMKKVMLLKRKNITLEKKNKKKVRN